MEGKWAAFALAVVIASALYSAGACAAAFTAPVVVLPAGGNASWHTGNTYIDLNLTTNMSCANVSYGNNSGVLYPMTGSGTSWRANITNLLETYYEKSSWNNITISIDYLGANETNFTYNFKVDTIAPVVSNHTDWSTIRNSSLGDYISVLSSSIVENNTKSCGYRLYFKNKESDAYTWIRNLTGTVSSTSTFTPNCNVTVESSNFTSNGYYTLEAYANDDAAQTGYTNRNETLVAHLMKEESWNLIGVLDDDNRTLTGSKSAGLSRGTTFEMWAGNHTNVTYVSMWNSTGQAFVTYQWGTATNEAQTIDLGTGLYAYVSSDIVVLRHNHTTQTIKYENITLYNLSTTGPWTCAGIMYRDYKFSQAATATPYTNFISYHNMTDAYFYPYMRTSGPKFYENNTLIVGDALFMDTNRTADTAWSRRLNLAW